MLRAPRPALLALAQDSSQPALVRSTALWLLSEAGEPAAAPQTAGLLADDDPMVRAAAAAVQTAAAGAAPLARLAALLNDPAAMVRIEVAKLLMNVPPEQLPASARAPLQRALNEWRRSLEARIDYPETHMVLGGLALMARNIPEARAAFREAVRMDPQLEQAWIMRIRIAAAVEGPAAAMTLLREALEKVPQSPALAEMNVQLGGGRN